MGLVLRLEGGRDLMTFGGAVEEDMFLPIGPIWPPPP